MQRGGRLVVQSDLISVADGAEIWGEQYSRTMSDVMALQGDMAREISSKLRLKLTAEEERQLTKPDTENIEAYQLYVKGRYYAGKGTQDGLSRGLEYFRQAIDKDPNYALAYDGLAKYYLYAEGWFLAPKDAMPKAREAAKKALELDGKLAEAHTSVGVVLHLFDWDWPGAEREFERAIELNSGHATAHECYAMYLVTMGRFEEGFRECERAQALDPLSLEINTACGWYSYWARRYDQAVNQLHKTIEIDPNYWSTHMWLGAAHSAKGQFREAIAEFEKARHIEDAFSDTLGFLGNAYARAGKKLEALKLIDELKQRSKRTYVPPYYLALIYTGLGEKDRALEWLEQDYRDRDAPVTWLKVEPEFDSLRSDPRFQDLVDRMNFPP
jgi:tetratricopeptide (TPR) repeat protein